MSDYNITDLLSPAFLERMQKMLGNEYEDFIKSYEAPRTYGLRVNTAKISCEEFEKIVPFPVTPIRGFRTDIFILKMSVLLSVLCIRQDFIICRNQVP